MKEGLPIEVHNPTISGLGQPTWMMTIAPDTWKQDRQTVAQSQKVLWTPGTGRRILIMGVIFSTDTAMNIQVEEGGRVLVPPIDLPADGGANILFPNGLMLGVDVALSYTSSANGGHSVMMYGKEF